MSESNLSLTKSQLEADVGFFLGFGRGTDNGDTAWTTRQQQAITDSVNSGIRMFYFPTPLPGETQSYDWSFMRPTRLLEFADGETWIDLPDDFGGLEGDVYLNQSGRYQAAIPQTNEQKINKMVALYPSVTGQPQMCAVQLPSQTNQYSGQRARLLIYPTADQDYTLQIQYYLLPDALSTTFPYALGGSTHAETIKAAVKAAAELYQDNERGPMNALFIDRMRASISLDRRNKAQHLGYNGDPSFNRGRPYGRYLDNTRLPITYNGVSPG